MIKALRETYLSDWHFERPKLSYKLWALREALALLKLLHSILYSFSSSFLQP
jgi:hypothetical protein